MLLSNMPPLEAAKILCSLLASKRTSRSGKLLKLALYDISRAHFFGESQRAVYVSLPEGDEADNMCALLHKTMYGTQDASHVWQEHYSRKLIERGFVQGQAWTSCSVPTSRAGCHVVGTRRRFLTVGRRRRTEISEGYVNSTSVVVMVALDQKTTSA